MKKKMPDLKQILKKAAAFLSRNWQWKLLSLFLAVCLWSGLITQDDSLTREKIFSDVAINITNADTLRRNGFIIVSGLDDLPSVRIRADVPQKNYNTVTASNYNLRVDLSRIHKSGEQTLQVLSSSSSNYGTVTDISVESVTVQVDEYITRSRIPVRLNTTGEIPGGFYAGEAQVDPAYVVVSGPKSIVENIVRCVADYDLAMLSGQAGAERTAVPFRLVDGNGDDVDSELIDITSQSVSLDSIIVSQTLYTEKSLVINTSDLTSGTPADGYLIRRVSAEPATLFVAGKDPYIDSLNELHLAEFTDQQIDVSGLSTAVTRNISLTKSNDIVHFSSDTVMITVEIAPR